MSSLDKIFSKNTKDFRLTVNRAIKSSPEVLSLVITTLRREGLKRGAVLNKRKKAEINAPIEIFISKPSIKEIIPPTKRATERRKFRTAANLKKAPLLRVVSFEVIRSSHAE